MIEERKPPLISRPHLLSAVFIILLLVLLYLAANLLVPFFPALLWAAVLVIALYPVYRRLLSLTGNRSGAASALMAGIAALVIIVPMILLLAALATQAVGFYQWTVESIKSGNAAQAGNRLTEAVGRILAHPLFAGIDMKTAAVKGISQASLFVAEQLGNILRNMVHLSVTITIMLISLFFFFRDGDRYYQAALSLLPVPREHQQSVATKLRETFSAILFGVILIALLQGFMTGLGFFLFDVPFPVLWGFLAAALALLPVGGAALVWFPGCLYVAASGSLLKAALLAVWGLLLVTLPDNILKPVIIGKKSGLPAFFLFLGILGGIQAYGFPGVLAGPLIITLVIAVFRIVREEYLEQGSRSG